MKRETTVVSGDKQFETWNILFLITTLWKLKLTITAGCVKKGRACSFIADLKPRLIKKFPGTKLFKHFPANTSSMELWSSRKHAQEHVSNSLFLAYVRQSTSQQELFKSRKFKSTVRIENIRVHGKYSRLSRGAALPAHEYGIWKLKIMARFKLCAQRFPNHYRYRLKRHHNPSDTKNFVIATTP